MTTFLFSGQGTQMRGMGKALFKKFPMLVTRANDLLDYSVEELCLVDHNKQLNNTKYTQPAIFIVNALAYLEKYYEIGKRPDYAAGHSLGEYNALFAAEVFDFETGIKLVKKRGELMANINNGTMAAVVGLDEHKIADIIKGECLTTVEVSNENSPIQFVLSGSKAEIENSQSFFEKAGASMYSVLKVSGAFHSSHMAPIVSEFKKFLGTVEFKEPKFEVIANVSAVPYSLSNVSLNLCNQLTNRVKWTSSMVCLLDKGEKDFVEINPSFKDTLTKLQKQIMDSKVL